MNEVELFQAIANVGSPQEREQLGPIRCQDNPWLGEGFYFRRYAMGLMRKLGLASVKVASVLEFMKQDGLLPYRAIRAEGRKSKGARNVKFIFDDQGMYYLQPVPKFQLCIIDFPHFHIAAYKFLKYGWQK